MGLALHIPAGRKGERHRGPLPGFGGITEECFPPGRATFIVGLRFLLFRPLGRSHGPTGKLPGFPKLPGIGGRIGFEGQHIIFFRLAFNPVYLLLHPSRIILQEGKQVESDVQARRIEVFRLRLFGCSPGLLQPVQIDIAVDEGDIIHTAHLQGALLASLLQGFVMLPEFPVDRRQVVMRQPISPVDPRPQFIDWARLL